MTDNMMNLRRFAEKRQMPIPARADVTELEVEGQISRKERLNAWSSATVTVAGSGRPAVGTVGLLHPSQRSLLSKDLTSPGFLETTARRRSPRVGSLCASVLASWVEGFWFTPSDDGTPRANQPLQSASWLSRVLPKFLSMNSIFHRDEIWVKQSAALVRLTGAGWMVHLNHFPGSFRE